MKVVGIIAEYNPFHNGHEYHIQKAKELKQGEKVIGCSLDEPFMTMAFLSLSVIPELKLTDKGLMDVMTGKFTNLFTNGNL